MKMSRSRLIALLLALLTVIVYLPVVSHGFTIFDDNDYVTNNNVVQGGLTWAGVKWAFTTGHAANWHPLTWISHMTDCELFGLNARAHHLVNVVFHAANAALLFVLLFRMTGALWPPVFAAALFALHPLHVESVAWIAERKDLLSTVFALLALLMYVRFVQARDTKSSTSKTFYLGTFILFTLSLLSKPMMVTLPFVMLLLDYWPLHRFAESSNQDANARSWKKLTIEKTPFFVLSASLCVITFFVQHAGGMVFSLESITLGQRLKNVPVAYMRYLLKMIWPADLAVFYPFPKEVSPVVVAVAAAVLILITVAVWWGRKRSPYALIGWLCFLGTLVPVIGFVPIGGLAMADRYVYFPSIGIFAAASFGVGEVVKRLQLPRAAVTAAAALVLAACVAGTERQLGYWRDDVTLFSRAIEINQDNGWTQYRFLGWLHLRLGIALENEGRKTDAMTEFRRALELEPDRAETHKDIANLLAGDGQADAALAEYQKALQIDPDFAPAYYNLGVLFVRLGRYDEAMKSYTEAVRLAPDYASAHLALARLLAASDHPNESLLEYQNVLRLNPRSGPAHLGLGSLLVGVGQFEAAMKNYSEAARLSPSDWHPLYLEATALLAQGRAGEAAAVFRQALQIDPDNVTILISLAQVLASDENPQVRDGHKALALAQRAMALSSTVQPAFLDVLSMAYAEVGKYVEAQGAAQDALNLAEERQMTNYVANIRQQLQLYRNRLPFRSSITNTP